MAFRLGRVTDCQDRLKRDYTEFARAWAMVKEVWLDDRCQRFERDHLSTLGPSLSRFSAALTEFSDAVRQAQRELKDDRGSSEGVE